MMVAKKSLMVSDVFVVVGDGVAYDYKDGCNKY